MAHHTVCTDLTLSQNLHVTCSHNLSYNKRLHTMYIKHTLLLLLCIPYDELRTETDLWDFTHSTAPLHPTAEHTVICLATEVPLEPPEFKFRFISSHFLGSVMHWNTKTEQKIINMTIILPILTLVEEKYGSTAKIMTEMCFSFKKKLITWNKTRVGLSSHNNT